ncbi:hypothetical protein BIW11_07285 [Tropilaelaps mercedesae]|uniref:UBA domain-containing protein n=1 Tax=Tropilaelaps mercedesae TaxID=418985 RepID=A0A1V9XUK6_9ACAR|nr:hypothetical protein BIW11_07285 [Tropilaelaps mercedesae]
MRWRFPDAPIQMKPQSASGGGGGVSVGTGSSAKKEKIAPQATAEQLRIAEITNVTTEQDSVELHKKIKNVVEFTGRSQDEAAMVLHDCDGDVEEAINFLLEASAAGTGWETSGAKKKKEKQVERRDDSRRPRENRDGPGRGRGRSQRNSGGGGYYDNAAGPGGGRGRPRGSARGGPGQRDGRPPKGAPRSGDPDPNQPGWSESNGTVNSNNNNSSSSNNSNSNNSNNNTSGGVTNSTTGEWETNWIDPASSVSGSKPTQNLPGQNASTPISTHAGQPPAEELATGQQNDTIGNMGNWDDFKADEKNANEWNGPRKERTSGGAQSEWVDAVGERNADWKTRQRQPGNGPAKNGPPGPAGAAASLSKPSNTATPSPANAGGHEQTAVSNVHHGAHAGDAKVVQTHQQQKPGTQRMPMRPVGSQGTSGRTKVRLPPASKIPQTPVEMPPDHQDLHGNTLDLQFGALTFGSSSYDSISTLSQNPQQPTKVEQQHNGPTGLSPAAANLLASAAQTQQAQPVQASQTPAGSHVASHRPSPSQQQTNLKTTQPPSSNVETQPSTGLKSLAAGAQVSSSGAQVSGQNQGSITVPPGLDKTSVTSVGPTQTHKTSSMSASAGQSNQPAGAGVSPQYHNSHPQSNAGAQSNQAPGSTNTYQQYSVSNAYKQQTPNTGMAYLQSLSTGMYNPGHSTTPYGQQATQYGSPNYATSFGSTVASAGYKGGKDSGAVASASVGAVTDAVNSTGTSASSQYDGSKKSAASQLQQGAATAAGQAMTPGGLVLQPGQLHGPHMHAPYHMTGHPGAMQTLYSYYHPGQLPPPTGSGAHLATADYSQRDNSSSSANAATMSASSLLQQHSYEKFVRSQDESSSAAASQGSSTAGSQSTITATAAYPHLGPYNIYYGGAVVPAPFPHMPFMSAQGTGYPATNTASTATQASKNSTAYGNSQSTFEYPMSNHMSGPTGDYKYQSNKMMSSSNKYMSATAGERR